MRQSSYIWLLVFAVLTLTISLSVYAGKEQSVQKAQLAKDNIDVEEIYKSLVPSFRKTLDALVRAKPVNPPGGEERAIKIIAERLKKEGVDYKIDEFAPGRQSLVARLKGNGQKRPMMLIAHIDVVGTDKQEWSVPQFEVTEKDGYLYGRGVQDDLGMAVANLEVFLLLKKNKTPLDRDIILAFTGDEESGGEGITSILKKHPDWVDAEFALNEGGSPKNSANGGPIDYFQVQMAEKTYQDFNLIAKGTTGHSSIPRKDNAIYKLSQALLKIEKSRPRPRLIEITREYLRERAAYETGDAKKAMLAVANAKGALPSQALKYLMNDPLKSVFLTTTCVATMLSAGTKANALPAEATALVNCRILPDEKPEDVQAWLVKTINSPDIEVKPEGAFSYAGPSPHQGPLPQAIRSVVQKMWPNENSRPKIIPFLSTGATDSRHLRAHGIASYGLSPLISTNEDSTRAHGVDERIQVATLPLSFKLLHNIILEVAAAKSTVADCKKEELYPVVSKREVETLVKNKSAVIIDVNSEESFKKSHIPGAIHYLAVEKNFANILPAEKSAEIVAYCGGPMCTAWQKAARKACELGYTNIKHYKDGIKGWDNKI